VLSVPEPVFSIHHQLAYASQDTPPEFFQQYEFSAALPPAGPLHFNLVYNLVEVATGSVLFLTPSSPTLLTHPPFSVPPPFRYQGLGIKKTLSHRPPANREMPLACDCKFITLFDSPPFFLSEIRLSDPIGDWLQFFPHIGHRYFCFLARVLAPHHPLFGVPFLRFTVEKTLGLLVVIDVGSTVPTDRISTTGKPSRCSVVSVFSALTPMLVVVVSSSVHFYLSESVTI